MKNQKGFTLIEMMISMTIALIVLGGAAGLFVKTLQINSSNLVNQKADQTIRTLNDVIVSEIRRAGYTPMASITPTESLAIVSNNCVHFSRYINDTTEYFYGYRTVSGSLYTRKNTPTNPPDSKCGSSLTDWVKVDAPMFTSFELVFDKSGKKVVITTNATYLSNNVPVNKSTENIVTIRNT